MKNIKEKVINWLWKSEEYTYINDNGDELVSVHTNGELLLGTLVGLASLTLLIVVFAHIG